MARFHYGPWDDSGDWYGGDIGFFDVDRGGGPLIGFRYRPFKPWFD